MDEKLKVTIKAVVKGVTQEEFQNWSNENNHYIYSYITCYDDYPNGKKYVVVLNDKTKLMFHITPVQDINSKN